jgi:hypothetical protein
MKNKIEKAKAIANNALYFDDSSDYRTSLWEILFTLAPEMFENNDKYNLPELEYIPED